MLAILAAAALSLLLAGPCSAQLMQANFDGSADATIAGQAVAGEVLPGATLVDEGLRAGGLLVTSTGGVKYPSEGFPLEQGCLQMWVRADFDGTDEVRRWFFDDANDRFKVFKYTNGELYFQLRTEDGGVHAHTRITWQPGEWHHIACTWRNINSGLDDAVIRLYIDGALAATAGGNYRIPAIGNALYVGCDPAGEEAAEAVLDDFKLFDQPQPKPDFPPGMVKAHNPDDYALEALGATATASTQILAFKGRDYPAEAVIDGQVTGAYWASDFIGGTAQGPEWVEVDLGQPHEIARIGVYMVAGKVGTLLDSFTISVMSDGQWVPVAQVEGYQAQVSGAALDRFGQGWGVYWARFAPLTTQKVRLEVPGTTARVQEIEVLAPAKAAQPLRGRLEDPAAVNVFDFGGDGSKVAEGALPVTATTLYDEEAGYGWESLDGLVGVERGMGFDATRDFVAGTGDKPKNTFMVKLPPGEYALGIIAGDTEYDVQRFSVVIEDGQASGSMVSADRCDLARFNAVAQVRDGRLDVRVFSDDAWLISALVIGPAERLGEADAKLTEIERQFSLGDPGLLRGLQREEPEPRPEPAEPTGVERGRGYQVFAPSSCAEQVWPGVAPTQGSIVEELRAACTAGEYEPVTLAVHALKPLRKAQVDVGYFAGFTPDDSPQVDVRLVQCWPQRFKMQRKNSWAVMPELLRNTNFYGETWVPEGGNQQWWLTIHVAANTPPGEYKAVVSVSAENGGALELPLTL
ncbi:MAG TPA: LamG-like jellyroll fold domain-containing protein, partial [Armatimonadota bacterium]|nr:LamG-like jellyroll fold domain-containing protein [Armatimonadota bacterium]